MASYRRTVMESCPRARKCGPPHSGHRKASRVIGRSPRGRREDVGPFARACRDCDRRAHGDRRLRLASRSDRTSRGAADGVDDWERHAWARRSPSQSLGGRAASLGVDSGGVDCRSSSRHRWQPSSVPSRSRVELATSSRGLVDAARQVEAAISCEAASGPRSSGFSHSVSATCRGGVEVVARVGTAAVHAATRTRQRRGLPRRRALVLWITAANSSASRAPRRGWRQTAVLQGQSSRTTDARRRLGSRHGTEPLDLVGARGLIGQSPRGRRLGSAHSGDAASTGRLVRRHRSVCSPPRRLDQRLRYLIDRNPLLDRRCAHVWSCLRDHAAVQPRVGLGGVEGGGIALGAALVERVVTVIDSAGGSGWVSGWAASRVARSRAIGIDASRPAHGPRDWRAASRSRRPRSAAISSGLRGSVRGSVIETVLQQ